MARVRVAAVKNPRRVLSHSQELKNHQLQNQGTKKTRYEFGHNRLTAWLGGRVVTTQASASHPGRLMSNEGEYRSRGKLTRDFRG